MRNLDFKYVKADNFMCFSHIEIDFKALGNIVVIKARNLDADDDKSHGSNGTGKCFGKNTPILMFDGTVKLVQDVEVGDLVMGNDSTSRKVLSLGRGREMMYKVTPKKGDPYIVNQSHVLALKSRGGCDVYQYKHKYSKKYLVNISVDNYFKETFTFRRLMGGYRASVKFTEQKIDIDPYFLGLWLGDGNTDNAAITNVDKEIIDVIYKEADNRKKKNTDCSTYYYTHKKPNRPKFDAILAYKMFLKQYNYTKIAKKLSKKLINPPSAYTIYGWVKKVKKWLSEGNILPKVPSEMLFEEQTTINPNPLLNDLRKYNLIGNKHIPHDYKANSREIRLQVLAGLLDSDGYMNRKCYDIVQKSKLLAEDILFLARSLGLAAYMQMCYKSCQTGAGGIYWRVSISGNTDMVPTKLHRKQCGPRLINKDPLAVGIKVEPIGIDDYYGFAVDGNHLFLLGDFTVVHNSSVINIPTYALFGQTIKNKINHSDIINHQIGKKMEVEFIWDKYRVIRTRSGSTGTLRFWESEQGIWSNETEITCGGMPATQKEIEKRLGINYETFVNLVVFTDDNSNSFLECDAPTKRRIIENLLSLDKYRDYFENAKIFVKNAKDTIKNLAKDYDRLLIELNLCKSRVSKVEKQESDWKEARNTELKQLILTIKTKKAELEKTDQGAALTAYKDAQMAVNALGSIIPNLEAKKDKLVNGIDGLNNQCELINNKYKELKAQLEANSWKLNQVIEIISKNEKMISSTQVGGELCPYCEGILNEKKQKSIINNIIKEQETIKKELESKINTKEVEDHKEKAQKYSNALTDAKQKLNQVTKELTETHAKINNLSKIKEPRVGVDELIIQEQIEELKKQALVKKTEIDSPPFTEIKKEINVELVDKQSEVSTKKKDVELAEEDLPYYDFWVKAFGDTGIRKYIIQGILPALNARIAYWLQFLSDNKISLTLDSELKEKVDRFPFKGRPYVYYGLSNGQRRRLILALSQALAHIQMLNAGTSPSVVVLDEVSINLDESGVEGAYRMICELAKEKQVFVIDHNESLLQSLEGCDTIFLQMQNEVTTRVESFD